MPWVSCLLVLFFQLDFKIASTNCDPSVWGISHGRSVIPKSKSPERITQNFDIAFELEEADIQAIDKLDKKIRFNDSSKDFGYELFTDLEGKQK